MNLHTHPRWNAVRGAMRQLTAVTEAHTATEAEHRFEQLLVRAERSVELTNAAYVAAQILRDSEILSRVEAAYVFCLLFTRHTDDGADAVEAQFHRARGETALAQLVLGDREPYLRVMVEGKQVTVRR